MAPPRLIDQDYLRAYHQQRPGITEAVLDRARRDGTTAYQWLAEPAPIRGPVLDLACGSAPMRAALSPHVDYLGVDRSPAELAAARLVAPGRLVRADALSLPVRDSSMDAVVCSMALMILQPLEQVLDEIRRVLRRGGLLLATVPADPPRLPPTVTAVIGRALTGGALWQNPNTAALRDPKDLLTAHGFTLLDDDRRSFAYPLRDKLDAELLLDSLYLPELSASARRRILILLRALTLLRTRVPIPIRRLLIQTA
ncbi:MAG TPA: class I SAM-dependent methyltransferase [Thermoleophilia bacterium]|nr:class I SAM-dependent methyltransferase [Thermoleophilia bacterium]